MNELVSEVNLVFSCPIWTSLVDKHQEINTRMEKYINTHKEVDTEGKKVSNIDGWHSKNFDLKDNEVVFFINSISYKIKKTMEDMGWDLIKNKVEITNMWSIINNRGSSNSTHIHPNCYLSAAYYVKAPKNCGDIVFHDPREGKLIRKPKMSHSNNLNAEEVNIQPQAGMLVLFPSYLYHSVRENLSDNERTVISFNIDLK